MEPPLADRLELAIANLSAIVVNLVGANDVGPMRFLPSWHIAKQGKWHEPEGDGPEVDDGGLEAMRRLMKFQNERGRILERRRRG